MNSETQNNGVSKMDTIKKMEEVLGDIISTLKASGMVPYNKPCLVHGIEVLAQPDANPLGSSRVKGYTHWTVDGDYLGSYENGDVEAVARMIALAVVMG